MNSFVRVYKVDLIFHPTTDMFFSVPDFYDKFN